jgi:hypothetical protein
MDYKTMVQPEDKEKCRVAIKKKSQMATFVHRFAKNRLALTGFIVLVILALGAIFADFINVGDTVVYIPGHCCTTLNLHDTLYLLRGDQIIGSYPVTSRSKFR